MIEKPKSIILKDAAMLHLSILDSLSSA